LYLYGAIELSSTPWLLKTWKRIGGDWDHKLTVTAVYSSACAAMVEKSPQTAEEMVTSTTTVFWMMLSYSTASSLFTTTNSDQTMISTRFTSSIGQCVSLIQQHLDLKPRVANDYLYEDTITTSQSNSSESLTSSNILADNKGQSASMLAVEIAYCDWLAFVGSSLSTVGDVMLYHSNFNTPFATPYLTYPRKSSHRHTI